MRYIIALGIASLLGTTALAEVPRVVTDIPPVHSLVAQVMGDLGTPDLLLEPGADEHSFQLRPSQAAALHAADVVFWIGPELTPWLERGLESVPETVTQVALLGAEGTKTLNYAEEAEAGHEHEHDHDHDHGEEAAEAGHDHDHGDDHAHDHSGIDPHAWLAPANAQVWVGVIAAELSQRDPANAATYAANAATAMQAIADADAAAKVALGAVTDRPFVVFHDAYGYFANAYGLTLAGTIADGDAAAPGAARMVELQEIVSAGGAVCLFPEAQHDAGLMDQIAEGSSVRIGPTLDPVGSTLEPGPGMYVALIGGMARAIAGCLSES